MINLGDITKISGYNAPTVDVVIGGSPCQDLSVAGKRAGLAGERSGLYMEQIRIIKEMREHDRSNGRAAEFIRPRYMVWENVPGAFSSNHGKDFAAVLEEAVRVIEPEAPHVPVPEKGWPTSGCLMGDGWSVAWRVLDAQFWGVPQRRRRIALIADFGGHTAPEILFVRESVSGDSEPGSTEGEGTAGDAENGVRAAVYGLDHVMPSGGTTYQGRGWYYDVSGCLKTQAHGVCCLNDQVGSGMSVSEDVAGTLREQENGHQPAICIQGNCIDRADTAGCNGKGWRDDDVSFTLNTIDRPAVYAIENHPADSRVKISYNGVVQTLSSRMGTGGGNVPMVAYGIGNGQVNEVAAPAFEKAQTINTMHDAQAVFCQDVAHTQKAKANLDFREDSETYPIHSGKVRRLTPLECERLQGFPCGWTDIGDWVDSKGKKRQTTDSARYKALGNSIALPPWKWVLKRLCAQYERDATMASLFDGIGGFPLIWEQLNGRGSCLWSSEIDEFPIAVTKYHFEED